MILDCSYSFEDGLDMMPGDGFQGIVMDAIAIRKSGSFTLPKIEIDRQYGETLVLCFHMAWRRDYVYEHLMKQVREQSRVSIESLKPVRIADVRITRSKLKEANRR